MTQKKIEGETVTGENRVYTFELMNTETALELFHNSLSALVYYLPDIRNIFLDENGEPRPEVTEVVNEETGEIKIKIPLINLAPYVFKCFEWTQVKNMIEKMLIGGSVIIDSKLQEFGPTGFPEFMRGDPVEMYTALYYALQINYPKIFDFLTERAVAINPAP